MLSKTSLEISNAARAAWEQICADARSGPEHSTPERLAKLDCEQNKKIINENNRQFKDVIFPNYQKMVDIFTEKMWLAEKPTQRHYEELLRFVDLWSSSLGEIIPPEVYGELDNNEKILYPFYEDLQSNFDSLREQLSNRSPLERFVRWFRSVRNKKSHS